MFRIPLGMGARLGDGKSVWPCCHGAEFCERRVSVYFPDLAGALAGADGPPSSTECALEERSKRTTRPIDVHMKMIADQVVRRVSTLAAARGPNAVCEPWPP